MTTEEKLEHFSNFCMTDARTRSTNMLDEYTAALTQTYETHKADSLRRADERLKVEREKITRDINKQLAMKQLEIKRTLGHKQDELKDMLFTELKDMLSNYMETPAYQHLLEEQISKAKEFAGEDKLIIYLDPADEDKLSRLSLHHSLEITISEYSFFGGSRAVIPSKNILIDNSFQTKLAEAKQEFRFELDLGGECND